MKSKPLVTVKGSVIDDQTRCIHYLSALDIIAIKFKCCDTYYPCYYCHQEEAGHETQRWPKDEWDSKAILCGVCNIEMAVREYFDSGYNCPSCKAAFNPGCGKHDHLYFDMPE